MPKIKPIDFKRISSLKLSPQLKEEILLTFKGYGNISIIQRYGYVSKYRKYYTDSVELIYKALNVSKSGFYSFLKNNNYKFRKDLPLVNAIEEIQSDPDVNFSYGVHRIKNVLEKNYKHLLPKGTFLRAK